MGAQLLIGTKKDTVLQYRYYYCKTLPAYKEWSSHYNAGSFRKWWRNETDNQALWEKHTGTHEYDNMDDSSAMRQCGLTWDQFYYLYKMEKGTSRNPKVSKTGREHDADEWATIAQRSYLPEVTEEAKFWHWAGANQREVKAKLLLPQDDA